MQLVMFTVYESLFLFFLALESPRCMNMWSWRFSFLVNLVPHMSHESFTCFPGVPEVSLRSGSGTSSPSSRVYSPFSIVFLMWSFRYLISLDNTCSDHDKYSSEYM